MKKTGSIRKKFVIGDKWVYYKIYCGSKTADSILIDIIKPLIEELKTKKIIDKWFFIRYSDPEPHLRIRFLLKDILMINIIIFKMKQLLESYIESYQIWDISLNIYEREIERYGVNTIEDIETLFFYDSEQVIEIIKQSEDDEHRFINIFIWLESIISSFSFSYEQELSFLNKMQQQFKDEFQVNLKVKKELNQEYIKKMLLFSEKEKIKFNLEKEYKNIISKILFIEKTGYLEIPLEELLASFLHMTINRTFRSKQRLYEMMLYDFLYKRIKQKF